MKKSFQLISVALLASFMIGCASSQLEADVETLKAQMKDVQAQTAEANQHAKAAEAAAMRAEQTAADTNSKLDRMFKKSMMK